jgi:hypothetical protein
LELRLFPRRYNFHCLGLSTFAQGLTRVSSFQSKDFFGEKSFRIFRPLSRTTKISRNPRGALLQHGYFCFNPGMDRAFRLNFYPCLGSVTLLSLTFKTTNLHQLILTSRWLNCMYRKNEKRNSPTSDFTQGLFVFFGYQVCSPHPRNPIQLSVPQRFPLILFFPAFFLFFCSVARLHLHNHPLEDLISPVQGSFPMKSASPGCYPRRSHHAPLGLAGPNGPHFGRIWAHRISWSRGWRMGSPSLPLCRWASSTESCSRRWSISRCFPVILKFTKSPPFASDPLIWHPCGRFGVSGATFVPTGRD